MGDDVGVLSEEEFFKHMYLRYADMFASCPNVQNKIAVVTLDPRAFMMQSPQIPFELDAIRKLALANGWKLLDMSSFIGAMRDFGCAPPKEFHVDEKGKFTAISYEREWWHWWCDKDGKLRVVIERSVLH